MLTTTQKWSYFEYGAYIGTRGERERVLNDFILGRLDVGSSNSLPKPSNMFFLDYGYDSRHVIRHCAALRSISR